MTENRDSNSSGSTSDDSRQLPAQRVTQLTQNLSTMLQVAKGLTSKLESVITQTGDVSLSRISKGDAQAVTCMASVPLLDFCARLPVPNVTVPDGPSVQFADVHPDHGHDVPLEHPH